MYMVYAELAQIVCQQLQDALCDLRILCCARCGLYGDFCRIGRFTHGNAVLHWPSRFGLFAEHAAEKSLFYFGCCVYIAHKGNALLTVAVFYGKASAV